MWLVWVIRCLANDGTVQELRRCPLKPRLSMGSPCASAVRGEAWKGSGFSAYTEVFYLILSAKRGMVQNTNDVHREGDEGFPNPAEFVSDFGV